MLFYADANYSVEFRFPYPPEWDDSDEKVEVPSEQDWQTKREFDKALSQVLFDSVNYYPDEVEWYAEEDGYELVIRYHERAQLRHSGLDSLEDIDSFVRETISDFDDNYEKIKTRWSKYIL